MSRRAIRAISAVTLLAAITACGNAAAEEAAKLAADSARAEGATAAEVTRRAEAARTGAITRGSSRTRSLASGTTMHLVAVTDVSSQKDEAGKPFVARTTSAVLNAVGQEVIPAGADLVGSVTTIFSAASPGATGALQVAFNAIQFGGQSYAIDTRVVSLATRQVARGVTTSDAAKVGVGAAVGAAAGRIIGGNATGTAVGAAAGGTAGVVYANRTKDHDIVLSPGSAVVVALTSPFSRSL